MTAVYSCPVELALATLGGKWRVVILARLKQQACGYATLRRLVPRMSEKMLTQRLRELVDEGLVAKNARVYSLTPRGESARVVLEALYAWGETLAADADVRFIDARITHRKST